MENLEFSVDMKPKYMYIFQLRHSYLCVSGIIGLLVSISSLVYFFITKNSNAQGQNVLLILGACLFTIIFPWNLFTKSYRMVKLTPVFQKPLNYKFDEAGITISQNEENALLPWADVTKVLETSSTIYIYTSPKNGYIMPKEQYVDKVDKVKNIISTYVDKATCVVKLK